MCHTVMIAKDDTEEVKERIAALPSYSPVDGKYFANFIQLKSIERKFVDPRTIKEEVGRVFFIMVVLK